jgi:Fe-Mn family superoxide dismutase
MATATTTGASTERSMDAAGVMATGTTRTTARRRAERRTTRATLNPASDLAEDLAEAWGTTAAWREDFARTGAIRGVGWAILYHDPSTGRLFNWWVSSHEVNHPAGFHPVLVMDVFEHAWMVDHGAGGRDDYIAAFLGNVRWEVVEQRYKDSMHGRYSARF